MRDKIGLPSTFTLDACRHGGMTELEEAELTDGQGRRYPLYKSNRPTRAMPRARWSEPWRRPASGMRIDWRTRREQNIQNEPRNGIQNDETAKNKVGAK